MNGVKLKSISGTFKKINLKDKIKSLFSIFFKEFNSSKVTTSNNKIKKIKKTLMRSIKNSYEIYLFIFLVTEIFK